MPGRLKKQEELTHHRNVTAIETSAGKYRGKSTRSGKTTLLPVMVCLQNVPPPPTLPPRLAKLEEATAIAIDQNNIKGRKDNRTGSL